MEDYMILVAKGSLLLVFGLSDYDFIRFVVGMKLICSQNVLPGDASSRKSIVLQESEADFVQVLAEVVKQDLFHIGTLHESSWILGVQIPPQLH